MRMLRLEIYDEADTDNEIRIMYFSCEMNKPILEHILEILRDQPIEQLV